MAGIAGSPRPEQLLLRMKNTLVGAGSSDMLAIIPEEYRSRFEDPSPTGKQIDQIIQLLNLSEGSIIGTWDALTAGLPRRSNIKYDISRISAVTSDFNWMLINPWIVVTWGWESVRDYKAPCIFQGLLCHELAHTLYTPMGNDLWTSEGRGLLPDEMWSVANLLEDTRIETLLVKDYPDGGIDKFLSDSLWTIFHILENDPMRAISNFPIVSSREHLPKDFRKAVGDIYEFFHGSDKRNQVEKLTSLYRDLGDFDIGSKTEKKALEIIKKMYELCPEIDSSAVPCSSMCPDDDSDGESFSQPGESQSGSTNPNNEEGEGEKSKNKGKGDEKEDDKNKDGNKAGDGKDGEEEKESKQKQIKSAGNEKPEAGSKTSEASEDNISDTRTSNDPVLRIPQDRLDALQDALERIKRNCSDTDSSLRDYEANRQVRRLTEENPDRAPSVNNWETRKDTTKEWAQIWKPKEDKIRRLLSYKSQPVHRQPIGRLHMNSVLRSLPSKSQNYRSRIIRSDQGHGDIELVAAFDTSASMDNNDINTLSRTTTYIKKLSDNLGFSASMIAWSTGKSFLYGPADKAETRLIRYPTDCLRGGTDPSCASSIAMTILENSDRRHKFYLNMTDGSWGGVDEPLLKYKTQQIQKHGSADFSSHLVLFGSGFSHEEELPAHMISNWTGYDTRDVTDSVFQVAELFVSYIEDCVKGTSLYGRQLR